MENASKALIIAGAVLLSIAIIAIGMFVYNSVSTTIQDSADMSQQEIQTYNQDFLMYEGVKSGSQVRQLCTNIRLHNTNNSQDPSKQIVLVEGVAPDPNEAPTAAGAAGTTSAEINTIRNSILSGRQYNVTLGSDSTGRITVIGVQLVDGSTATN